MHNFDGLAAASAERNLRARRMAVEELSWQKVSLDLEQLYRSM
jgi:hypothetical protein